MPIIGKINKNSKYKFMIIFHFKIITKNISWIVYEKTKVTDQGFSKRILRIYFYHLIINFTWSFVFFYYHLIFAAFINILFLIIAIIILMVLYFPRSKISFGLMIPYLIWVIFAAVLNFGLYLIN